MERDGFRSFVGPSRWDPGARAAARGPGPGPQDRPERMWLLGRKEVAMAQDYVAGALIVGIAVLFIIAVGSVG